MKNYTLELDKSRELRFGFKALRAIREKFGDKSIDQLLNIKVDEIPVLVMAGLKWDEKELTLDKVEDLLDAAIPERYTILEVTTLVLEALAAQMGVDVKKVPAGVMKKEEKKAEVATEKKQVTETIPSTKKQKK